MMRIHEMLSSFSLPMTRKLMEPVYKKAVLFHGGVMADIPEYRPDGGNYYVMPFNTVAVQFDVRDRSVVNIVLLDKTCDDYHLSMHQFADGKWFHWSALVEIIDGKPRFSTARDQVFFVCNDTEAGLFSAMFSLMFDFFHYISQSNVEITTHTTKRNPKSFKESKLPIYEYRTVVLKPDEPQTINAFSKGGTHASPREHLRRGHYRKLTSGKIIWVKQCTVGNAALGRIDKEYKVVRNENTDN